MPEADEGGHGLHTGGKMGWRSMLACGASGGDRLGREAPRVGQGASEPGAAQEEGGGGVWFGGGAPGPGGNGGGILYVGANSVQVDAAAALLSNGQTTTYWASGSWTYGAGGGSGGTVWLVAQDLVMAPDAIQATGGFGESSHIRDGGDGGFGRVRVDYATINGYNLGTIEAASEESLLSSPAVGASYLPQ